MVPPPIGVLPEHLWDEQHPDPDMTACMERAQALTCAILRRVEAGLVPPAEWVRELNAVVSLAYDVGRDDGVAAERARPPVGFGGQSPLTVTLDAAQKAGLERAIRESRPGAFWIAIPADMIATSVGAHGVSITSRDEPDAPTVVGG